MPLSGAVQIFDYTVLNNPLVDGSMQISEYVRLVAPLANGGVQIGEFSTGVPSYDTVISVFDEVGFGDYVSFNGVIGVFDEIVSENPAKRYVWNGSTWIRTPEYVWNGTAWQEIV